MSVMALIRVGMALRIALATLAAAGVAASVAPAAAQSEIALQEQYQDERHGLVEEWVAVSDHYKHSDNCTSDGCVIMGPMSDRDACEEWTRTYNRIDPFDHARCVSARSYSIRKY